jgi:hypothetical protein
MAILMSSAPLIFGAMEAEIFVMMSGSWHMSRNSWRSARWMDVCGMCLLERGVLWPPPPAAPCLRVLLVLPLQR